VVPLLGCHVNLPDFRDPCEGIECPDDGNECTREYCACTEGTVKLEEGICKARPVTGIECDLGGPPGLCSEGQCEESPCGVCDDDNLCTDDYCSYVDERCVFAPVQCRRLNPCNEETCNPLLGCIPVEDGTPCFPDQDVEYLRCQTGVCVGPCDPQSEKMLQCPTREGLFCCPGVKECLPDCEFAVQP
jgi:hypothetical protein